jgi:hypothetical protein
MQLGGLAGMTALTMGLGQERGNGNQPAKKPAAVETPPPRQTLTGIQPENVVS